jgi:hypothetical protein
MAGPRMTFDYQARFFRDYLLGLSPREALRKAGVLSVNFWLFREGRRANRGRPVDCKTNAE